MKPRKNKEIAKILEKKGFKKIEGDHSFYFFFVEGKKTSVRTKISHGRVEYGRELLSQMAKQLNLTNSELQLLFDCPLTQEKYTALLIGKNIVIL